MTKEDRTISAFLTFLEKDIEFRSETLRSIPSELKTAIADLTSGVDHDPDAPIESITRGLLD